MLHPVAVVLDGEGLTAGQMQRFAHRMNLSETTFVLPPTVPGADDQVRIFTPAAELPFAGHPTLGTCHAWLARDRTPPGDVVVQQCDTGLVPVRRTADGLAFAAPPLLRPGLVDLDLGVVGPYPPGSPQAFEVRAFFPKDGATAEDPSAPSAP